MTGGVPTGADDLRPHGGADNQQEASGRTTYADSAGVATTRRFYGSGPLRIVVEADPECQKVAKLLHQQCTLRDVGVNQVGVDMVELGDAQLDELAHHVGLIFVLRALASGESTSKVVQRCVDVFAGYRSRKTRGLAALAEGEVGYFTVGVVQVFLLGTTSDMQHPAFEPLREACHVQALDDTSDGRVAANVFEVYDKLVESILAAAPSEEKKLVAKLAQAWADVRRWGVGSFEEMFAIWDIIEYYRTVECESRQRHKYRRPLKEYPKYNRLDLTLFAPEARPKPRVGESAKAFASRTEYFVDRGSSLVRTAIARVDVKFPGFKKPPVQDGKATAGHIQPEFRKLYLAIRMLKSAPPEYLAMLAEY